MKNFRGYCASSKKRVTDIEQERLKSFIERLSPSVLRHALQPFPVPHGFRPGQPKTVNKQIEQFIFCLGNPERQPRGVPVYQILELIWRNYGHAVLEIHDELRQYSELVDADESESEDSVDLMDADIQFIDAVVAGGAAKISSEEFFDYCEFAPFELDDSSRSKIKAGLPDEIAVKRERQIDEAAAKIEDLEAQIHEVRSLIDVDEDRIAALESTSAKIGEIRETLGSLQSSFGQIQQTVTTRGESLDVLKESVDSLSESFSTEIEQSSAVVTSLETIDSRLSDHDRDFEQFKSDLSSMQTALEDVSRPAEVVEFETREAGSTPATRVRTEKISPSHVIGDAEELKDHLDSAWASVGVRKSWRDVVSLVFLTCLRSGAILMIRGDLRTLFSQALANSVASVLRSVSIPVGTIEAVDSFLGEPDAGEGLEVQVLESVNLAQSELAIPESLDLVRRSLVSGKAASQPILRVATVGAGGLFVEPEPQLAFSSVCLDTDFVPLSNVDGEVASAHFQGPFLQELLSSTDEFRIGKAYEDILGTELALSFRKIAFQRIFEDMNFAAGVLKVKDAESLVEDAFFCTVCVPRLLSLGFSLSEIKERGVEHLGDEVLNHRMGRRLFDSSDD